MRAFLAVEVPPSTTPGGTGPRAPAHFTLLFFEELPEEGVEGLVRALTSRLSQVPGFRVGFGRLGAFPNADRPRIVFRSVAEGAAELDRLARAARDAARECGLRFDERPFVAHLTLYRVRSARDRDRAVQMLGGPSEDRPPPFDVRAVTLKRSELTRAGAEHTVLAVIELAAPAGAPG